jgi:hypothetical protein
MSKVLEGLFYSKVGQTLIGALGVKAPLDLNRFSPADIWVQGKIAITQDASNGIKSVLMISSIDTVIFDKDSTDTYQGMLLDATDYKTINDLMGLKDLLSHASKRISKSGHVVIIGRNPANITDVEEASVMESLIGFTRSLA